MIKRKLPVQTNVAKGSQEGLAVTLIEDIIKEEWDQPNARQRESIKVLQCTIVNEGEECKFAYLWAV